MMDDEKSFRGLTGIAKSSVKGNIEEHIRDGRGMCRRENEERANKYIYISNTYAKTYIASYNINVSVISKF